MFQSTWKDYSLSRLMLGTVQFGMPYGVANRTGQPAYRDVVAIVKAALDGGVNCFDTAASYGASEEVLGRVLAELGVADRVVVVTKVRPLTPDETVNTDLARRAIEQSVDESRGRLHIDCLPVVLFHRELDAVYLNELERLRQRGWLMHFGVSCDNRPGPAAEFVESGSVSALQIPGNILDRRHQHSGVFEAASSRGIAVFMRSVYLQGLLVMPPRDIPLELQDVIPLRNALADIASQRGMQLPELALRYLLTQPGVTSVLVGVETVGQVTDNLAMFDRGPLDADTLAAINALALDPSEALMTPSLWPQLRSTS